MSDAVLPVTAGFKLEAKKIPIWSTRHANAASGKRRSVSQRVYPMYQIKLAVEVLRDMTGTDELKNLMGFFNQRAGGFDSFRYTDPEDYAVTDHQFGVRASGVTEFQLIRTLGGFAEPVNNVNVLTNIKSDGTPLTSPTDYTISATGLVTLASAGTPGEVLTWSGSYYWRVVFDEDRLEFGRMFQYLHDLKNLPLYGSVMNKV